MVTLLGLKDGGKTQPLYQADKIEKQHATLGEYVVGSFTPAPEIVLAP